MESHSVVIVGAGFGGLTAARALADRGIGVSLIDRQNYHLFQPLLYQVATGTLSPADIATPLRPMFSRRSNVEILLGTVTDFDIRGRRVLLEDGEVPFDSLIVAAGARHSYFGHDDWEPFAPGLKTPEHALDIRRRIFLAFEAAERETDPVKRRAWLTFVIVGGGPTGVEMAGAIAEIAHHTLRADFRHITPSEARILLVEGEDRMLPPFAPKLSAKAAEALERLHVTLRFSSRVTDVTAEGVAIKAGDAVERVAARTVIWAAGVQASPLGKALARATDAETDRGGRMVVDPDCSVPGHPNIFVIGDLAHFAHGSDKPLPGLAPVAMQEGRYVADVIARRLAGERVEPFRYRDRGALAVIGRARAVADLPWLKASGRLAWAIWSTVHLMELLQPEKRVLVFLQWVWTYLTWNRNARLIIGPPDAPRTSAVGERAAESDERIRIGGVT